MTASATTTCDLDVDVMVKGTPLWTPTANYKNKYAPACTTNTAATPSVSSVESASPQV